MNTMAVGKIAEMAKTRDSINRDKIGFIDLNYRDSILRSPETMGASRVLTPKDLRKLEKIDKDSIETIDAFIKLLQHISYEFPRNSKEKVNEIVVKTVESKAYLIKFDIRSLDFFTFRGEDLDSKTVDVENNKEEEENVNANSTSDTATKA